MAHEFPASSPDPLGAVFKAYDIRGTVPDELNARTVHAVGIGFGRFVLSQGVPDKRVVVGRDMRTSGVELGRAFSAGVLSAGLGVVDIGLASTDLLYFASGRLDLAGAMLTASHNPSSYNGVKLCLPGARPIGRDSGLGEVQRVTSEVLAAAPGDGGVADAADSERVEHVDLLDDFAAHVQSFVDVASLRPLKVVADTANGMGGLIVPAVFAGLPFELEILYPELDGTFPNHPADPIQAANLQDLRSRLRLTGGDVGLAFDGDADRVFLVDELAEPMSGSLTTAIVAAAMLERYPGSKILYNLICSRSVPEIITERGGIPIRTRVGHSFIKAVMADTGAVFGGEHSGHYYFRDNYRADSGIIAALVVLEVLSRSGASLSELRIPFDRYSDSGEINTHVPDPAALVGEMAELYRAMGAKIDDLDGITVDLGDWWFNLRPSNTEPLLRLNLEAPSGPECKRHVDEVLGLIHRLAGS
ncbi:MAG TPA: phosphomannomutase/phosphoglucomutase [Acidimicrobiales bacterium]|nr:phosphomannomutase/phosphoglucomutase [Acidimicrobiales bacterium]